ncbi:hypothetical protein BGX33_003020 [Mortierella sp. NVP41]|nr:hypothetical protein BGX33_003020 [Mortierella sp. NVP41]
MPYTPLRSNLILFFQALTVIFMAISLCAYNIHGDDPDPELQMAIKMNELLHTLYTTRYIAPRNRIPISTDWRLRVLEAYEDKDFVSLMRMTKAQFYTLVDLIKDDPVFIPKGNKSQMPIREQLKICLYRLGVPAMLFNYVRAQNGDERSRLGTGRLLDCHSVLMLLTGFIFPTTTPRIWILTHGTRTSADTR